MNAKFRSNINAIHPFISVERIMSKFDQSNESNVYWIKQKWVHVIAKSFCNFFSSSFDCIALVIAPISHSLAMKFWALFNYNIDLHSSPALFYYFYLLDIFNYKGLFIYLFFSWPE